MFLRQESGAKQLLEIKLGRLKHDPGYRADLSLRADCFASAYGYEEIAFSAPLEFCGQAENIEGEIEVRGQLKAQLALVCSRCGSQFSRQLDLPFQECYSAKEIAPDSEGEQDKRHFDGDTIDLAPEALLLIFGDLPMQPLCREDCRGLCPGCGADLNHEPCSCEQDNFDPRWEKLRALMKNDS